MRKFLKSIDIDRILRYDVIVNNLREIFSKGKPAKRQGRKAIGAKPQGTPASYRIVEIDMYDISKASKRSFGEFS